MEPIDTLFRQSLDELKTLLDPQRIVGEPIVVNGTTLIPLFSVGFGYGGGGGSGRQPDGKGPEGTGGGTGAGGGVKPVAVVIVDATGVRVEPVRSGSGLGTLGEALGKALEQRSGAGGGAGREE